MTGNRGASPFFFGPLEDPSMRSFWCPDSSVCLYKQQYGCVFQLCGSSAVCLRRGARIPVLRLPFSFLVCADLKARFPVAPSKWRKARPNAWMQ